MITFLCLYGLILLTLSTLASYGLSTAEGVRPEALTPLLAVLLAGYLTSAGLFWAAQEQAQASRHARKHR